MLELLHILLAVGLLGKLHLGLSVLFEEHNLQDSQEVGLVRAEKNRLRQEPGRSKVVYFDIGTHASRLRGT